MEVRVIARMDIKGPNLIKPVNLEGVRRVGDPEHYATRYYEQGIDELLYMDAVASLYNRNNLTELVEATVTNTFVPMTVGGGIRSLEDVDAMLRSGADKIAINTAAHGDPNLIDAVARRFGSQCMVLSIEAKRTSDGFEAYYDCGREKSGRDVIEWAKEGADRGAGEILLTSVDCEGMRKGFDVELTRCVTQAVNVPVIASGGMGRLEHLSTIITEGQASAVAMAHVLHFDELSVPSVTGYLRDNGMRTR
jgi:cyclase